jgi:peptide chain release factor 2
MFDEESAQIRTFLSRLDELSQCLNIEDKQVGVAKLEEEMAAPNFWDDPEAAQKIVKRLKSLKAIVTAPSELQGELEDTQLLIEMAQDEGDESVGQEISEALTELEQKLNRLEVESLLSDPRDAKNAIINIHPGAGGTESCDWAEMLYRMITRYCERHEYDIEVLDFQPAEEAGLKSAALLVSGPSAYGNLKSEAGVHRLVRISPFDANKRRHTSFAAVEVLTEVDDTIEIEIREEDIRMDVFRASGAGGQHVNKTSSAVRLTHMPTGIVVSCQMERSQHRNRATAESVLKAKLYDIEQAKQQAELDKQRDNHQEVAWGSQIRSYVLHPYQMIKDHRTNVETGNVERVLDGDLDTFVEGYLKWNLEQNARK